MHNVMPWLNMAQASELAEYLTIDYTLQQRQTQQRKNNNAMVAAVVASGQPELNMKLKLEDLFLPFVFSSFCIDFVTGLELCECWSEKD